MASSTPNFSSLLDEAHSRKLLLQTPLYKQGTGQNVPAPIPVPAQPLSGLAAPGSATATTFDANVVMVLAVLLCALICALGLNLFVRCAIRCSSRIGFEPDPSSVIRLATARVRRKVLRAIPVVIYSAHLKLVGSECAICLSDLVPGERVRILPKCNHGFHVRCIDRWLMARSSCPTCRQCLFSMGQKSSTCETGSGQPVIVPLDPEGYVSNYRGVS